MVDPDPDLLAARPELMMAAAAAFETAAHLVNSVANATGRASSELLAEWKGRGAEGFAGRMAQLASATPGAAQRLGATATALRTLAPRISDAQALAHQATILGQQAATTLEASHSSNLTAIRVQAADDATTADTMTARANAMALQAWQAASAAFDAITGTSPSLKTASLTSAIKTRPAHQPHGQRPKISPDQVKIVTQPDGRRVYSFDGGLAIPADLPGAHQLVEEIKAYMPRLLAGHTGGIQVPAGLSAKNMWYEAARLYITTSRRPIPPQLRDQFSTATSTSITFKTAAGMSMFGMVGAVTPGGASDENNDVTGEQIVKTNQKLGTSVENGGLGKLIHVDSKDPAADELARRIGGIPTVRFENGPDNEFDAVSKEYVAQAKPANFKVSQVWRSQAKLTFKLALQSGRTPYFQFDGPPDPDVLKALQRYAVRYGIQPVIDLKPLGGT